MEEMIVKNVDVMGDFITAAKDHDGNVWVGVRWVCDALDMTEGQTKRQIANIQKDMVFSEGGSNQIPLPTNSGIQEVFCIRNDFVPLWLAKINITQKTREERPEFSKKLLEYQLKAKDILAAAFLPKQESAGDVHGQIKLLAQGTTELYERVGGLEDRFKTFEESLPLFPEDADAVKNALNKKVVEYLGGKESNAYHNRSICRKTFIDAYRELKRNFEVGSYKSIKRNQKELALRVIESYKPPLILLDQIVQANAQQSLPLEGGVQ